MPQIQVTIVNELGMHARPAAKVAQTAGKFSSNVIIARDNVRANAKSILGLLTLACPKGTVLDVEADGADAEAALAAMAELFAGGFGEL